MRWAEICEDVISDMDMNKMARNSALGAIDYITEHGFDAESEDAFFAFPESMGWDKELGIDDVMFGVRIKNPRAAGMSGALLKFASKIEGKYEWAIILYCLSELNHKEARKKVCCVEAVNVIAHEMLHYLDSIRSKERMMGNTEGDPMANKQEYYNDPAEFNAYYHDMCANLHSFINDAIDNADDPDFDVQDYADLWNFKWDFKDMLKQMIHHDRHSQAFWKWLTDDRRKALLKRIYRLHTEAKELIRTLSRKPLPGTEGG